MKLVTGARLGLGVVTVATLATAACSSDRQEDPCRTTPATVTMAMPSQQNGVTAHAVKARGSVNIKLFSSDDALLFEPTDGFAPFTVSRGGYLSYATEQPGSYTVNEVDVVGRAVATARVEILSC